MSFIPVSENGYFGKLSISVNKGSNGEVTLLALRSFHFAIQMPTDYLPTVRLEP